MSTKFRRTVAAFGAAIALAAGITAATAPAPAAASVSSTIHPLYCSWNAGPAPSRGGQGVIGRASSSGCESIWNFDATLQSSRWYGWSNDITLSWRGDDLRYPSWTCAGTHDYRVMLEVNNGLVGYTTYSPQSTLTC